MSFFPDTIAAVLAGQEVRASFLVHFDFLTQPMRVWAGYGALTAGGHTWNGLGELGSLSGLESAIGGTAPETTFTLSGVDPVLVSKALTSSAEVKGRDVTVYIQFFDANWQTLDAPFAVYMGTMDVMRIKASGPTSRTIDLTAESAFARRALPPFAFLTDRDQQRRHPGDRGLEQIPALMSKTVEWPKF